MLDRLLHHCHTGVTDGDSLRAGLNILVAAQTQAGKTTMLNCLASAVPGGERIISAEEVFELRFSHP